MTFNQFNLNQHILKAINTCGYANPTPIQFRTIPEILKGKDVIASAHTGSGKTAAFVLPALHRLSSADKASHKPRVLILTPTRELASQITTAAEKYGKFLRLNRVCLVGGMPYPPQIRDLLKPVDLIVATPGRLIDHLERKRVDLSGIEMLILDEADRMLDMGFIDDILHIAKSIPNQRQTLLFSATIGHKLTRIINQLLKNPIRIDLSCDKISPEQIKQELYITDGTQHKTLLLKHLLTQKNIYKAIIFTGTKIEADKVASKLREQNLSAAALHGGLRQSARNRTLHQLRSGKIQFLVATDVAARGIDVADISHVINYDLPRFVEDYVHRIGRTGRAKKEGIAISFAHLHERNLVKKIEKYLTHHIQESTIPGLEPKKQAEKPKMVKKKFGYQNKFRFKSASKAPLRTT